MSYEEFQNQICTMVRSMVCDQMEKGTEVTIQKVYKNNGTVLIALCIMEPGSHISPTIYLEDYYERFQKGEDASQLAKEILTAYQKNRIGQLWEGQSFCQWEKMKGMVTCKLIHGEKNRELLEQVPHRKFLDMEIVYNLEITDSFIGQGIAQIQNSHLQLWKITEEELFQQAFWNTAKKHGHQIHTLNEMISRLLGQQLKTMEWEEEQREKEMLWMEHRLEEELCNPQLDFVFVMTNQEQYLGAVTMIYDEYLCEFAEKYPEGFYVIPGSIHEVLLIPRHQEYSLQQLWEILQSVNMEWIREDPQAFLSDNVYYYDPQKHCLILCEKEAERE